MKKILCCILSLFCFVQILYSQQKEYKAYLVATAHFDTQWNWDVRESIDDYLHRTMVQNFWLFERFPNYIFNFESAQKYAWMKEYYPVSYTHLDVYKRQGLMCMTADHAQEFFQYAYDACKFLKDAGFRLHTGADKEKAYTEVFLNPNTVEDIMVKQYGPNTCLLYTSRCV